MQPKGLKTRVDTSGSKELDLQIAAPKVYPKSISSLKMYRTCGRQWEEVKFNKISRQPAAWLPQGTAFHAVDEAWERSRRSLAEPVLRDMYYDTFDSELAKYKEEVPNLAQWLTVGRTKIENDIKARRERGWDQFLVFKARSEAEAETWMPWEMPDGELALEVPFFLQLGDDHHGRPLYIRGYVDSIIYWPKTGQLTARDLKSGNREKTAIQLGVYSVAMSQQFGEEINFGEYYYSKDNTFSGQIDLRTFNREYLLREFIMMEKGIEARVFNTNPGDHCALCPAKGICPEYDSAK